jgi:outer membrane lipoprotein-sorting protein
MRKPHAWGLLLRFRAATEGHPYLIKLSSGRKTMILKKMFCFFIIVLWLVFGCQTVGGPKKPSEQQPPEKLAAPSGEIPLLMEAKGAKEFINLLEERAKEIHSFSAPIVLSVSGKEIPSYEKLSGILAASSPGRYRITAYSSSNKAVFDFLTLPRGTALRWAPAGEENLSIKAGSGQRPSPKFMENLSLVMGAGPFSLPGIALDKRFDKDLVIYLLDQHPTKRFITRNRRIWFRGKEVLVTRIEEKDSNNLWDRFYLADYRLVDSHWIPHHLSLSYQDILTMEIDLKSIKLNDPIDEGLFKPDVVPTVNHTGM